MQIIELKEIKRGHLALALQYENQADRLQFQNQFLLETRQYYRLAAFHREKAAYLQEEIDQLDKRKNQLEQKRPFPSSIYKKRSNSRGDMKRSGDIFKNENE